MWPVEGHNDAAHERVSDGSVVAVSNGQAPVNVLPPPGQPFVISSVNLAHSPRSHVGNKYETHIHQNEEIVKGGCLGIELTSPLHARRLRCSVAAFVCWALFIASLVGCYFFYCALTAQSVLDIEVQCTALVWVYVKNSTRAERVCCTVATLILALSISLAVYFAVSYKNSESCPDYNWPWYIPRDSWLATPYNNSVIDEEFRPVRLVIIQHSTSSECKCFNMCAAEIRNLQSYFIEDLDGDICYNFMIGNDGRAYEGRGWGKLGAHTLKYNRCSVGIGFIGDYRDSKTKVTKLQEERLHMLLEKGVKEGFLHPQYQVVAAFDVSNTESPGSNLNETMQSWPHYDRQHRFRNKNCSEINNMIP